MKYPRNIITGCPECGVTVFDHDGKHYTPLGEYLLSGDMLGHDRHVEFRRTYVEHTCRPEDLDRYSVVAESVIEGLKRLIEDNPPQWLSSDLQAAGAAAHTSYSKLQEVTARTGLTRECPRCGAGVGSPCENLTERRRGNVVPTKKAHEERMPIPDTIEASELQLAREETAGAYGLLSEIQEALKTDRALEKLLRIAERC
jgi:ribosomal protein S27AE